MMALFLEEKLQERKKYGNLRTLTLPLQLIDFASSDYLGLARSKKLWKSINAQWRQSAALNGQIGATGSRLLTGNSSFAEELEEAIATFHGFEAGALFNCGYMANVGLLPAITTEQDSVFFDAQVHASLRDGLRLSPAQAFPFRHNDLDHLERRLQTSTAAGNRFVCIESLYSMDGSQARLREIIALTKRYDAHLIVDEAHAVGVLGPQGRGLIAENGLASDIFAMVVTFSKALGIQGAIVLGSSTLKRALINFSRSYIYTTALPFYCLAAIQSSYELFPKLEKERHHVQHLSRFFKGITDSDTHIQAIELPGNHRIKQKAADLVRQGFDVRALLSPTVQRGREQLRICLHAFNSKEEVSLLCNSL